MTLTQMVIDFDQPSTSHQNKIYYEYPSEIIRVPKKNEIHKSLRKSFREAGEDVPSNLSQWPYKRCYAVYFQRLGIEKYDPKKHDLPKKPR